MRLTFTEGFSLAQITQREALNAFRVRMGGSRGLEKESMKIIRNDAKQESQAYLSNPEEILDRKTVFQLEEELKADPIAKPWWSIGDNEELNLQDDSTDEQAIQTSRTNNLAYENRLAPSVTPAAEAAVQRNIRDLLEKQRDKSTTAQRLRQRARK